jgi:hypothetical protein
MKTLRADEANFQDVCDFLSEHEGLAHLQARRRADCITIETTDDHEPRARLRRVAVSRWNLEIADHRGRWEPTPYCGTIEKLLAELVTSFPWVLAAFFDPEGT